MPHPLLLDSTGLEAALQQFADARDWNRHHTPKNLAMALTGEVGELVEIFQWTTEDESCRVMDDPATAKAVRDEIADVTMYLVRLSSVLGIDLNAAIADKLADNARKYPPPPADTGA